MVMAAGLLVGCRSGGGDVETIGTGKEATLHGYCTSLRRMNGELGSLATVRDNLTDEAATRRSMSYLRDVRDHAPGELSAVWQDIIDGYQAQAIVEQTDRTKAVKDAVAKALEEQPDGSTEVGQLVAAGRAGYAALEKDEKADAPHERTARRLLREAVPTALRSVRGVCWMGWERG